MTGIANRTRLEERLIALASNRRRGRDGFAVHCIDLDRFKELNDAYGHQAGDELIKAAAGRLKRLCREGDLCARLGGDEFVLIQSPADAKGAEALADRIVKAMAAPFDLSVGRQRISCSLGVTIVREPSSDPFDSLRQADLALYRAKANGRGRYCFFELEMDAAMRARRALQDDLRAAIAYGQIHMVYQPQVTGHGKVVGVEALARWTHPVRGPISPVVFIPLAEDSNLIEALGEYTFRQVFADSVRWPDLKVAINVSAAQVHVPGFVDRVRALVAECGVDPKRFEIELTENLLFDDAERTHATLQALRDIGFRLTLDDFGTSFWGLGNLRQFPITKIKIDRSFVANLGVDREADEVVGAIVRLARALRLTVIAEGVETETQKQHLLDAGCAQIQGYVASHPIDADRLVGLLDELTMIGARDTQ